jgi:hypothetical protein
LPWAPVSTRASRRRGPASRRTLCPLLSVPASLQTRRRHWPNTVDVIVDHNSMGKEHTMSALSSVFQYIKHLRMRRARRKQKLTALLMLAHSGVVRASHVELHYLTPVTRNPSSRSQPAAIGHPLIHTIPYRSSEHEVTHTPQWARSLTSSIDQLLEHRPKLTGTGN